MSHHDDNWLDALIDALFIGDTVVQVIVIFLFLVCCIYLFGGY